MLLFVSFRRPSNWDELLSSSFWWLQANSALNMGLSVGRAASLHRKGLRRYRDIWCNGRFMNPLEVQGKFGLLTAELQIWAGVVIRLYHTWADLLKASSKKIECGEWVAVFGDLDCAPLAVCKTKEGFQPSTGFSVVKIPSKTQLFTIKLASKLLDVFPGDSPKFPVIWDERGDDTLQVCRGTVCRVRVLEVIKGPKKTPILLYYGMIRKLDWDPGRMYWPEAKEFMRYLSKQGRELLQRQARIPNVDDLVQSDSRQCMEGSDLTRSRSKLPGLPQRD